MNGSASETEKLSAAELEKKGAAKDAVDEQIERERRYQEVMNRQKAQTDERQAAVHEAELQEKKKAETKKSEEDDAKISVDRQWLTTLRTQSEKKEQEVEKLRQELSNFQNALKQHFNVDSATALAEKMEEAKKSREKEEESKLSRVEIAEKQARKLEKQIEEERIRWEQKEKELVSSRDDIIIQNALIQAAVANDVVNPKQLLQLLKHEFVVDSNKKVPVYKAEDGIMSLEERVRVFLEDPDNWNLVSNKIPAGSGTQASTGGGGRPIFTKAQLAEMRAKRPQEYKDRQEEILKAYKEGRVKP